MSLHDKALLVSLSVSHWAARKYDKDVSRKVEHTYGADPDAGRYNKLLIDKRTIKEVEKVVNQVRIYHYDHTLPWLTDGTRILASTAYFDYLREMDEYKRQYWDRVNDFLIHLDTHIAARLKSLGSMGNRKDYPSTEEIRRKYKFDIDFYPVPAQGDFRVDIDKSELSALDEKIAGKIKDAEEVVKRDLWGRIYGVVYRLHERLKDDDKIFRDSVVGNIWELVELLPALNVMEDPDLKRMGEELKKNFSLDPQDLREDKKLRADTAKEADLMLERMKGFL